MTSKQTNTQANKKQAGKKRQIEREDRERERANKTARVKWGRGKQEANGKYCECEGDRFVMGTRYVLT